MDFGERRLFLLYFPGYFDGEELIGVFDDTLRLREAYDRVLADAEGQYEIYLQSRDTELTIAEYHRETGTFEKIVPETLWQEEELFENAAHIGLPIPDKLREALAQLHGRKAEDDTGGGN